MQDLFGSARAKATSRKCNCKRAVRTTGRRRRGSDSARNLGSWFLRLISSSIITQSNYNMEIRRNNKKTRVHMGFDFPHPAELAALSQLHSRFLALGRMGHAKSRNWDPKCDAGSNAVPCIPKYCLLVEFLRAEFVVLTFLQRALWWFLIEECLWKTSVYPSRLWILEIHDKTQRITNI